MLDITMEVGTTVPIAVLLPIRFFALVLLSQEDAASGAGQVPMGAPGIGRAVWGVASALASPPAGARVR